MTQRFTFLETLLNEKDVNWRNRKINNDKRLSECFRHLSLRSSEKHLRMMKNRNAMIPLTRDIKTNQKVHLEKCTIQLKSKMRLQNGM